MVQKMNLKKFDEPSTFYNVIKRDFSNNLMENDLMLGLTRLLRDYPKQFNNFYYLATVEQDGKSVLSAFLTPPWNILVHAADEIDEVPYRILVDHLIVNEISLPGVNGRTNVSKRFADIWCASAKTVKKIHTEMRLFILTSVNKVKLARGRLVKADPRHYDLLLDWAQKFHEDVRLDVGDNYLRKHLETTVETGNAFIWVDGEPVCMTFRERPHDDGVSIGYVYTPPKLRGHGYATSCVKTVSERTLREGYGYCSLFTDRANPTSNSIYKKIGYRPACDYLYYLFE
jgi:hypothetical protein